jgi:hypothetical protein
MCISKPSVELRQALEIDRKALSPVHPSTAQGGRMLHRLRAT